MEVRKTLGVVLDSNNLGEEDSLATFYTRDYGLVRMAVQQGKKHTSFQSGLLQSFTWNKLEYYQGSGLARLNKLAKKYSFQSLREDLKKMSYGSYVLEFYKLTGTSQGDIQLYNHLIKTLLILEKATKDHHFRCIYLIFRFLALEYLGFSLRLQQDNDPKGKNEPSYRQEKLLFSVAEGGVAEKNKISGDNYMIVADKTINTLQAIREKGYQILDQEEISVAIREEINNILDDFIDYHLDLKLRSERFLHIF